jgi:hypothetical protein
MEERERICVMKNSRQIALNGWIPYLVFATTALVYFPVITWLLAQTLAHGQLAHAFIVFLLTGILLASSRDLDFRPVWKFTETCQNLLILSYIILAAGIYADWGFFILFSLAISLSSFSFPSRSPCLPCSFLYSEVHDAVLSSPARALLPSLLFWLPYCPPWTGPCGPSPAVGPPSGST